jgi:hypothetical protein
MLFFYLLTPMFFHSYRKSYSDLPAEAVLVNILGASLVIHAGLTYFITTNDNFRRAGTSEERQPLVEHADQEESKE